MKLVRSLWMRWRHGNACLELADLWTRRDANPLAICSLMQHVNHLQRRIDALRA